MTDLNARGVEAAILHELRDRLEKMPKFDRGISWQLRNWHGSEEMTVYGETANCLKWIFDNTEQLISTLPPRTAGDNAGVEAVAWQFRSMSANGQWMNWRECHQSRYANRERDAAFVNGRVQSRPLYTHPSKGEGNVGGGWQPIFTAPKDGTPVDLWGINHLRWDKGRERIVNVKWGPVSNWMGQERDDWQHGRGDDFEPTHWMPLPAPPALSTETDGGGE